MESSIGSVFYADAIQRLQEYVTTYQRTLIDQIGSGYDGIVFSTAESAIKALRFEPLYQRERDVYLRLQQHNVSSVLGFNVPQLIRHDDRLWVVEMEIVTPPFVLDFAGAYLDRRPDFDDDTLEEWEQEKREQFGDQWPHVELLLAAFRRYKIYLADVKPGNVVFAPPTSTT